MNNLEKKLKIIGVLGSVSCVFALLSFCFSCFILNYLNNSAKSLGQKIDATVKVAQQKSYDFDCNLEEIQKGQLEQSQQTEKNLLAMSELSTKAQEFMCEYQNEILFYCTYTSFLSNKLDSSQYDAILSSLKTLRERKFYRSEMDEMENFIRAEGVIP